MSEPRYPTYPGKLGDRHMRIWRQLVIGGSNKEIAGRTGLTYQTTKNQLTELYDVLGLNPERGTTRRARTLATLWGIEIMQQHPEVFRDVG